MREFKIPRAVFWIRPTAEMAWYAVINRIRRDKQQKKDIINSGYVF